MLRKPVSIIIVSLLVVSALASACSTRLVQAATGTVYIRADGSVDPPSAPIYTADNITYTLTGNITSGPLADGIVIEKDNIVVDGAGYTVKGSGGGGNGNGTTLADRSNVTLRHMTMENFVTGIFLDSSSKNVLFGNNVANNYDGIALYLSDNNSLSSNYVTANKYDGIWLGSSSNNTLSGNNVANSDYGILLFSYSTLVDTSNNTLSGNVMVGNQHNFDVEGPALSDFQQSVDTSNLVDGKPVYYFMNKSDIVVNADAYPEVGYLGFVNCHNVTVQGLNLTKNGQGLLLVSTNGSKIIGNNVENNYDGISLYSSSNSVLSGNNITANDYDGILLSSSSNNTLSGNNVTDSLEYGIGLYSSSNNNVLSGNNVNANQYFGISLESSSFNRIYHNNIDNGIWTALVYDSNNTWDDGFPSGGNYWSDYSMKYPNAIEVGSSGIWNTPYVIDASNVDHYPLVNQTALPLSTLWDPSRDSYGQGNYASSWSAGNCYGLSSTEILYFMHYVLGDMTYPYFPAQNPPANTTSQLNLPILNDETWTTLNNALLAVMFHQVYDPNHFFNSPSSESAECNKLVVALASGTPALLTMHGVNSTGNDIYHAIVAYGVETLPNGTVSIEVSDPNVLQTQVEVAYYDPTTQAFSYSDSAAGFSFDKFEVVTPEMIQTSWQSLWLYELTQPSWWFGNWLNCSVVGYNMVIADKMVTVDSNSLQDYFTVAGDSQTFVCGIPGSSGIEEGNTQVYAIPEGTSFTVSDPTSDQSAMLIDHVENESGQLVGYGYFLNVTTTQGFLNFTVTPSNSGLLLTSGTSAFNLSATIFYATLQNHSVYQVSNVSIDAMQTANFTVNNWQMLNDTSPSPVTLIITPEFPLAIILPLFMIATLLAALMFRRKRPEKSGKPDSLIGACQN